MTTYRRRIKSDVWHWMPECQHWITIRWFGRDYHEKQSKRRPTTGELCNECRSLERKAKKAGKK